MTFGPADTAKLIAGLAGVVIVTWGLAEVLRLYVGRLGMVDVPNSRSSHAMPTARGGGLAIVAAALAAAIALDARGELSSNIAMTMVLGGGLVALVGVLDDRKGLSVRLRLCAHAVAAGLAVGLVGSIQSLPLGQTVLSLGHAGLPITLISLVWFLNLFNFMDGIDGIAVSEAVFMNCAGGVLAASNGAPAGIVLAMFILAAACLGFIPLNWPPARMFMGDVGSGFLGFAGGVFALATIVSGTLSVWTWILLVGTFLIDATVTLLSRLFRGESIHQAHRSHVYQCLAGKWHSHGRVTLLYAVVNVGWLFPLAWLSTRYSHMAPVIMTLGVLPLVIAALLCGAGRP
jgi:Fuc2NAc and GlcNAc transferase